MQDSIPFLEGYLYSLSAINPTWSNSGIPEKHHHGGTFSVLLDQDYSPTKCAEIQRSNNYNKPLFHEDSRPSGERPIKIEFSPTYGRYLAATRDIAAGEVIFQERPMVLAPKAGSGATCLACLRSVEDDWNGCRKCGAPLCSSSCSGSGHSEQECMIVARLGLKEVKDIALVKMLNVILTPLRTLLLSQDNRAAGEVVAALQSNMAKRKKLPIGRFIEDQIVGTICRRMRLDVDSDVIHHICGVFDTNAFEVSINDNSKGRALFPLASLMNHSCLPNTQRWFKDGIMTVRAVTDIYTGEPVTNTYTPMLLGTRGRTAHLLATKLFRCNCQRCRDPTELGSHISSVVCRACTQRKNGLMVPPAEQGGDWNCKECEHSVSNVAVDTMIRAANSTVTRVPSDDPEALDAALNHLGRLLGHQHYITLGLEFALINAILHQPLEDIKDDDLVKCVDLTKDLLQMASVIDPGLSRFRGILLLKKLEASAMLFQRQLSQNRSEVNLQVLGVLNTTEKTNGKMEKRVFDKAISHRAEILLNEADECEQILEYDHKLPEVHRVQTLLRKLAKGALS